MKRILYTVLALSLSATGLYAGGLVTNTNQSASFLRNPARDGMIDIDGVYSNPAGVCFLPKGFHLGLTIQHPEQQRNITTSFMTLAQNVNNLGQQTRTFEGEASAPVVPSFQAAYVMNRWTISASFAITGGGGKCEFDNGIGSIETLFSLLPAKATQAFAAQGLPVAVQGYSLESYMKGRQYYFGIQLGAGYKLNDNVALFAGLRSVIASCSYTGYVRDIKLYTDAAQRTELPAQYTGMIMQSMGDATGTGNIEMTTDQSGLGWTPILGVDWRINDHWNLAARYEFRTRMSLENKTDMNDFARKQTALAKFNDHMNASVREDVPATLALGVQYSPIKSVRISGAFHHYDDCNAKRYNDEQDLIDHGTREFLLGAEWDINRLLTVSAGWQNTHYSLSDAFMQDMSYNLSSNLLGLGARVNITEKINLDLGYMVNFYDNRTVETANYLGSGLTKTDSYERKNYVFAIGVNFKF